jgi:K+ transporter
MSNNSNLRGIVNSMGLVFGDIGTSPIYTLTVIFLLTKPTELNVMGVSSLTRGVQRHSGKFPSSGDRIYPIG